MPRNIFLTLARMKKGLSLENMAMDLGISTRQYSNYENGHTKSIPPSHLNDILRISGIDKELINVQEGCVIISDSTISGIASGINNINYLSNEIISKQIEEKDELIRSKDIQLKNKKEQIKLYQKEVEQLRNTSNTI